MVERESQLVGFGSVERIMWSDVKCVVCGVEWCGDVEGRDGKGAG